MSSNYQDIILPMPNANVHAAPENLRIQLDGPPDSLLDLMWVEFLLP